ncbi:MAG: Polysaccharide pyruvyl transferase [Firmicutes bacterium ADurb.Bin193]|nr:MAG: Polysaccharide pyruvyl transferase [Firmicutes bacterium ADurb.Bin193]
MKKACIITFHASHNYGSALQAYALQTTIKKLGLECEILNFRTERQRDLYNVFTKRRGIKYIFKNASHLLRYRSLKKKYNLFEEFIAKHLCLGNREYTCLEELTDNPPDYDYYISGSDQIWNPIPADFDWAYYLPFVRRGIKISYAASFGPVGSITDSEVGEKIGTYIKQYDYVSVREARSKEIADRLAGCDAQIVLDPTLLLGKSDWEELIEGQPEIKNEYILFYTLFADREMIKIVSQISKKLKLPVIVTNFSNQYDVFTPFNMKLATGPIEFINLIKNAKLVCTSSFHGTVFSIIFQKPFYAIRGMNDKRISTLLSVVGLEDRALNISNLKEKIDNVYDIDFSKAQSSLEDKRERSLRFIRKSLNLE